MKENYENRNKYFLLRRMPVIIRLDGKSFHSFTKHCETPFDTLLHTWMCNATINVLKNIHGVKCAYIQSDEISILLTDYDNLETDAWFNNSIQKICSVSASLMTAYFNWGYNSALQSKYNNLQYKFALFDARCFNLPKEEVNNYFIWRQKDWERNSLQMFARAHFSHSQLNNKKKADIHEMLHKKDKNWADLDLKWKRGTFIQKKNNFITEYPVFKDTPEIINNLLIPMN